LVSLPKIKVGGKDRIDLNQGKPSLRLDVPPVGCQNLDLTSLFRVDAATSFVAGAGRVMPPKDSCRLLWLLRRNLPQYIRLLDSLSLSRHGESSSELSSVMILNPMFGISLWKAPVCRTV
jgi:hypothetical protein